MSSRVKHRLDLLRRRSEDFFRVALRKARRFFLKPGRKESASHPYAKFIPQFVPRSENADAGVDPELVRLIRHVFGEDGERQVSQSEVYGLVDLLSRENPYRTLIGIAKISLYHWAVDHGFDTQTAVVFEMGTDYVFGYSRYHRSEIHRSRRCGCFHCLSRFPPEDVYECLAGHTAVCPRCGVDSVLPDGVGSIVLSEPLLRELNGRRIGAVRAAQGEGVEAVFRQADGLMVLTRTDSSGSRHPRNH